MRVGPIVDYVCERGWFDTFLYPLSCKQDFTVCSLENLHEFLEEPTVFRQHMNARIDWLETNHIGFRIHYTIDDLTEVSPPVYHLFVYFKSTGGMDSYLDRWSDAQIPRIQPEDGE